MNHLRGLLLPAGSLANPRLDAFLALAPAANTSTTLSATSGSNIYRHTAGDRAVDIHVATIHSVKGETHDATLVLETLSQDHDLKTVLPHLCAKARAPKLSKREIVHMKHIFVRYDPPKRATLLRAPHESHDNGTACRSTGGWVADSKCLDHSRSAFAGPVPPLRAGPERRARS